MTSTTASRITDQFNAVLAVLAGSERVLEMMDQEPGLGGQSFPVGVIK